MATPQAVQRLMPTTDPHLVIRLLASKYYMLASVVILYFDHILTFDQEIGNLWQKRLSGPNALFLVNRYYPLLVYAIVLIAVHDPSWSTEAFKKFPFIAALVSDAMLGIIVILRLFALYGRSFRILCILLPLYVAQLLFGGWASDVIVRATGLPPRSGCIITVPNEFVDRFAWLWGSAAVFDTLIFGLTTFRTLRLRQSGLKLPLTTLFLRDGIIYFAVMFSAKLLNFVLFWTAVTANLVTLNWAFNNIITVVMINHLVLNLRQEASRTIVLPNSSAPPSGYSTYLDSFEANLGNTMGTLTDCEVHEMTGRKRWPSRMDPLTKMEDAVSKSDRS